MRFAQASVAAADARGKKAPEREVAQLAVDTIAVAAGDQTESVAPPEISENATGAGEEFRAMAGVVFAPESVGEIEFGARDACGAVDVVPVGRVVGRELRESPRNFQCAEHGEVGGGIGGVGIEEGAVPIEEDATEGAGGSTWLSHAFALFQCSVPVAERPVIGDERPEI
jgi:hypothetical protein